MSSAGAGVPTRTAAALGALFTTVLVACSAEAPRDSAGVVTAAATSDAFSVTVGDCVGKLEGDTSESLALIPCAEKHYWEAFATHDLTGTDFPGTGEVQSRADDACTEAFGDFVGIPADESKYELTFLVPTKETWTRGNDREVVCLVGSSNGGLSGSLQDAAK